MAKIQKKKYFKKFKKKKLNKKNYLKKLTIRFKRLYRLRSYITNLKSKLFLFNSTIHDSIFKIYIRLRSNNIFCTLTNLFYNKTR